MSLDGLRGRIVYGVKTDLEGRFSINVVNGGLVISGHSIYRDKTNSSRKDGIPLKVSIPLLRSTEVADLIKKLTESLARNLTKSWDDKRDLEKQLKDTKAELDDLKNILKKMQALSEESSRETRNRPAPDNERRRI